MFCLLGSVDISRQSAGTVSSSLTTIISPTITMSVRNSLMCSNVARSLHFTLKDDWALVFLSSDHRLISLTASRPIPNIIRPASGITEKYHVFVETCGTDCRIMLIR